MRLFIFATIAALFGGKAAAEIERPLKVEIAGSRDKPTSHSVTLGYGSEFSAKVPGLQGTSVYAMIKLKNDEIIVAKITVGKDDVVVVGDREFTQLSYLGLFMPDNFSDAEVVNPKDAGASTKLRLITELPTDSESIKILKQGERGAVRNDDRVSAAELRWLTGDWQETARHLELAGRDFFRKKDRIGQLNCETLEKIARAKTAE